MYIKAFQLWLLQYLPPYLFGWLLLGGQKPISLPAMVKSSRFMRDHEHDYGHNNWMAKCFWCDHPNPSPRRPS